MNDESDPDMKNLKEQLRICDHLELQANIYNILIHVISIQGKYGSFLEEIQM